MKTAIYKRVSTDEQATGGYSLDSQERILREWATSNGHEVVRVYEDAGISGKTIERRPAVKAMLEDAKSGEFTIVLVWALSRLTRSVSDLYQIITELSNCGVGIRSHTEPFDCTTAMGRGMMGIIGVFAQIERELTGERVKAAMLERAKQGKRTCNEVLGYDRDGSDSLKINAPEADIVRFIYDQYEATQSLTRVSEMCAERLYRGKRGRVFKPWHIHVILSRPVYAGFNTYQKQAFRGMHEPIIPVERWNRIQQLLHRKHGSPLILREDKFNG